MRIALAAMALAITACSAQDEARVPGDSGDTQAFDAIAANETLRVTGTEPFWGGTIAGGIFTYTTPENIEGEAIAVDRFAGRGGLSFSGERGGQELDLAITPTQCSDGMSDRTYPFAATLMIGAETREGCAWTDANPFDGPLQP